MYNSIHIVHKHRKTQTHVGMYSQDSTTAREVRRWLTGNLG